MIADKSGRYGEYGGMYVPEMLVPALKEVEAAYQKYRDDKSFRDELNDYLKEYVGRPTPLTLSRNMSAKYGFKIYLKREDQAFTGAHKINNTIGQALLAKRMGKTRLIAETGAGQHGVATATAARALGMKCTIYMGEVDIAAPEDERVPHAAAGADVVCVKNGTRTLKDAISEAMRSWVTCLDDTHYLFGTAYGPHPYPAIVKDFQSVIGKEARAQVLEHEDKLPDCVVACVGGGSNAIGIFSGFVKDEGVTARRRGGGRLRHRVGKARRALPDGKKGRATRLIYVRSPGPLRADPGHAQRVRGPGLCGRRPRARAPKGDRPRGVRLRDRRRGAFRVPGAGHGRRDPAGAGIVPRGRMGHQE